jgi:hypothetical protein
VKKRRVFAIRSKIWIEDMEGHVVFGLGRYLILDLIRRTGSMHAAAMQLQVTDELSSGLDAYTVFRTNNRKAAGREERQRLKVNDLCRESHETVQKTTGHN